MQAMQESLADVIGYGLAARDIGLRFEAHIKQQSLDMFCFFTFPCPATATPDDVTASMSKITATSLKEVLNAKAAAFGAHPQDFTASGLLEATVLPSTPSHT